MTAALSLLVSFLACTGGPSSSGTDSGASADTGPAASTPACWGEQAAGSVVTFATGFTDGTEGLAFSDGRLFVTTPTEVVELLPDGSTAVLWTTDHALGLAPIEGGLLLADPGEFSFSDSDADGEIWRVPLDGAPSLIASGLHNPNFLAPTSWGSVLMADDTVDGLLDISLSDGSASDWLPDVPSPNGIVLTDDSVTVASTFVDDGAVYRASVSDGQAGTAELFATTVVSGANDGLAAGWDGSVWVAVNVAGEIWRIGPDGDAAAFATGMDSPASLAFGTGDDWDPCSLYVTSLFGGEVLRVVVAEG